MKIVRLVRYFPKKEKTIGWISGIYDLTTAQKERGHNIIVVCGGKGTQAIEHNLNFRVIQAYSTAPAIFQLSNIVYGISSLNIINRIKPEIVHGHDFDPLIYSLKHKIKQKDKPLYALHSHSLHANWKKYGIMKEKAKGLKGKIHCLSDLIWRIKAEEITHKNADIVFAVSNALKEDICATYKIHEEKVIVTYNGIDTNRFKPSTTSIRKQLNVPEDAFLVIAFGGDARKEIVPLIKSFRKISKINRKLHIIIVGTTKEHINKKYNILDKRIIPIKYVPFNEISKYYNACDLMILPTRYETFGKTIAEAMSCQKPVISTNVCGVPEVIDHGKNGFLTEPGNVAQITESIETLMKDENLRKKMGINGRKKVLSLFTWDKVAERIDKGYKIGFELNTKNKK